MKVGGFVDTYYSHDFNHPTDNRREFTTQAVRQNQPRLNLGYVEGAVELEKFRSRLALQDGTSVWRNTSYEPEEWTRYVQEARVGMRAGERTWVDGGIYLGHIGAESWISKDNWTYTRALMLDYVPYYSAGVKISHIIDENQKLELHLMNGWQNVSENNRGKAVGLHYQKALTSSLTFFYNNFFGDEEVVSEKPRFRAYHDFILKWTGHQHWHTLLSADFGHQAQQEKSGVDGWGALAVTLRRVLTETHSVAFRGEYYNDRHGANVVTSTKKGFQVLGASFNFDQALGARALWRNELRGFYSKDRIYPSSKTEHNKWDGFFVTSLSMWF